MSKQEQDELIAMPERVSANAHVKGMHNYLAMWEKSVYDVDAFWGAQVLPRCRLAAATTLRAACCAAATRLKRPLPSTHMHAMHPACRPRSVSPGCQCDYCQCDCCTWAAQVAISIS